MRFYYIEEKLFMENNGEKNSVCNFFNKNSQLMFNEIKNKK